MVSIICPIYNEERFIEACIQSVLAQDLPKENWELLLVDGGSTDKTRVLIAPYLEQYANIRLLDNEHRTAPYAMNIGIRAAKGEYILMIDSDDLLVANSVKPILDKAMETMVDIVVAGFLQMSNNEIDVLKDSLPQQNEEPKFVEKTGKQLFMENVDYRQPFVWRILFRKGFIIQQQLKFHPGIYVQDKPFFYESYLKAEKCLITSQPIYIYRKHTGGVSFLMKDKYAKDYCHAIGLMWNLSNLDALAPRIKERMRDYTYLTVSALACRLTYELKDKNKCIVIIDYLNIVAPELRFNHGTKQRLITFLLRYMPHTYIRLRFMYAKYLEHGLYPALRGLSRDIKK